MSEQRYSVGLMKVKVEEQGQEEFHAIMDRAVALVEKRLKELEVLHLRAFDFEGPHLLPSEGAYSPLDFLELGLTEKLERRLNFLLMVTEVDLSATVQSYVLALPSQVTNVGILSMKRLSPRFWGEDADEEILIQRLEVLILHTLGHLLNLPHHSDPANIMYDFSEIEELGQMRELTAEQIAQMLRNLPDEAREEVSKGNTWRFALKQVGENWNRISHTIRRANPIRLAFGLPTMITVALSLMIPLFFTAEIWDVASSLEFYPLIIFSILAVIMSTIMLFQAFEVGPGLNRSKDLAESTVVTVTATILTLLLTVVFLYLVFFGLIFVGALTFFPAALKLTWPTADPAVSVIEHLKLGMFVAAVAVLAGSLGGRADSKAVVRHILFIDEET